MCIDSAFPPLARIIPAQGPDAEERERLSGSLVLAWLSLVAILVGNLAMTSAAGAGMWYDWDQCPRMGPLF